MASAEAILKKRMPEKVGILPVAELLFVAESMWVGEHDMKGHFHPSFRFVKAKRYNAKPHVLIELDGETLADINGRSKYYEGFSEAGRGRLDRTDRIWNDVSLYPRFGYV